jgi:hypothetical protein
MPTPCRLAATASAAIVWGDVQHTHGAQRLQQPEQQRSGRQMHASSSGTLARIFGSGQQRSRQQSQQHAQEPQQEAAWPLDQEPAFRLPPSLTQSLSRKPSSLAIFNGAHSLQAQLQQGRPEAQAEGQAGLVQQEEKQSMLVAADAYLLPLHATGAAGCRPRFCRRASRPIPGAAHSMASDPVALLLAGHVGKHSLLSWLLQLQAPAVVFDGPVVSRLIRSKWQEFAGRALKRQGFLFLAQFVLFFANSVRRAASDLLGRP